MKDADFARWLREKKDYSDKSASDATSRCRRIERTFAVSLDKALSNESGFEKLRERVAEEGERFLRRSGGRIYTARAVHRLALKLYFEFLGA